MKRFRSFFKVKEAFVKRCLSSYTLMFPYSLLPTIGLIAVIFISDWSLLLLSMQDTDKWTDSHITLTSYTYPKNFLVAATPYACMSLYLSLIEIPIEQRVTYYHNSINVVERERCVISTLFYTERHDNILIYHNLINKLEIRSTTVGLPPKLLIKTEENSPLIY
ncbi:hypothetical protein [Vibrio sonorensis]|uniref:hypothetical protein n=1 Tax=Vibrio sonorensis TaxID=1004316 RepID=UPI001113C2C3|nr:hypothetical protein [Vibrio sonorensis]